MSAITPKMNGANEFSSFFDNERRREVYRGLVSGYYSAEPATQVIFDTNRSWTGRAPLLAEVFPGSRIVCCVRDVPWILDSIEVMLTRNSLQTSRVFNFNAGGSVYSRAEILMNSENGLIGLAWSTLREMWFGELAGRMILIDYKTLTRSPRKTFQILYRFLEEEPFEHDFDKVEFSAAEYDDDLGMPGLHKVREKVEFQERKSILPPDLVTKYATTSFWRNAALNDRKVLVL